MEAADNHNPAYHHATTPIPHNRGSSTTNGDGLQSSQPVPLVPPYWSHRRYESYCSIGNAKPAPITLEDHTADHFSENAASVWAKGVTIDDHVLVSGSVPNVGSFVIWICTIGTLDVSLLCHGIATLQGQSF